MPTTDEEDRYEEFQYRQQARLRIKRMVANAIIAISFLLFCLSIVYGIWILYFGD